MTSTPLTVKQPTTGYAVDLAISAATFDADLVTELRGRLTPRLQTTPVWEGHDEERMGTGRETLLADRSCVALILHSRLWSNDQESRADAHILRARMTERPDSVCVNTLDDTELPDWLANAPQCDLGESGIEAATEFVLDAVAGCGGSLRGAADKPVDPAQMRHAWPEGPPPFLAQPRALSTLRREFDAIAEALETYVAGRRARDPEHTFELYTLPNRLIARLNDRAISVSWIGGRLPTVDHGRLLVIEWANLTDSARGVEVLKSATARREQTYRVEGTSVADWRWRVEGPNGRAYATTHLIAEWLASAAIDDTATTNSGRGTH
jgi:hypothetical protein